MWKYIAIASLVLIAAGTFFLYKTHQGLVSAGGEIAVLQNEYEKAISKNADIFTDEAITAYARKRAEWLKQRKEEADEQESKLRSEIVESKAEVENLRRELKEVGGTLEEFESKKQELLSNLVGSETLRKVTNTLEEEGNVEMESLDASDPEVLSGLAKNINRIVEKKRELGEENEKEESAIQALRSRKDSLQEAIAKEDALGRERQSRISPEELKCSVVQAEPAWDYVIVDAGVNEGVVIGSRLAVMRGEKKICEMNVTLVEESRSSCDILMDTLLAGEAVERGDRVVSVRPNKD